MCRRRVLVLGRTQPLRVCVHRHASRLSQLRVVWKGVHLRTGLQCWNVRLRGVPHAVWRKLCRPDVRCCQLWRLQSSMRPRDVVFIRCLRVRRPGTAVLRVHLFGRRELHFSRMPGMRKSRPAMLSTGEHLQWRLDVFHRLLHLHDRGYARHAGRAVR